MWVALVLIQAIAGGRPAMAHRIVAGALLAEPTKLTHVQMNVMERVIRNVRCMEAAIAGGAQTTDPPVIVHRTPRISPVSTENA